MKEHFWKYIFSTAGVAFICTILLFASKYVIAQEVEEQVAPIEAEYQQVAKTVSGMQFDERFAEVQKERDKCMEDENFTVTYCDTQAKWRWDVWYPYLNCIAGKEYVKWEDACGPEPKFVLTSDNG